jgi:serine protease Do
MVMAGGIALAIPSPTLEEFVRHGASPRVGVTIQPVRLNRKRWGLLVLGVETGSPAEQASLMMGDVLVGTSETAFAGPDDLADAIAEARAGRLTIRFLRGDRSREREVVVALGGRPAREAA